MERPVFFESDGLRLCGILGSPDGQPTERAVTLVHGWSGYRIGPNRILVNAARALNSAGVATLRFDLRGRGDSEGVSSETGLDDMIADTGRATQFLRAETRARKIALLGICSGANVAIGAATLMPEIEELMLWSILTFQPQKSRAESVRRSGHFALGYARKLFRGRTWRKLVTGQVNFGMVRRVLFGGQGVGEDHRNMKDSRRDIMAEFARYRGRALFIHGSKDPEATGARKIFQPFCAANAIQSEFVLIPGANHNFHSAEWKSRVIESSVSWLLTGKTAPEQHG